MAQEPKFPGVFDLNSSEIRQIPGDEQRNPDDGRRQSSRLQKRAPSGIQVKNHALEDWKVPIPLLSPLVLTSPKILGTEKARSEEFRRESDEVKVVFRSWQHPASESSSSLFSSFMPQCIALDNL
ncbi:hypothetical protein AMTR_s00009p00180840 [Amborella trichopoda]|uniref:Uncharacterized protein n=1 Tax=Amborella trichopoda TaxID=13333 RepID=W1NI79_AMBTC|nr:hypothetical protein AMTR_s00009p00180840 [Amborella trichopoda]